MRERIEWIKQTGFSLRQRLADNLIPSEDMRAMLAAAGVSTDPAAVGIDRTYHRETFFSSLLIRRRYTFLDFLEETGRFDEAVDNVFSAGER